LRSCNPAAGNLAEDHHRDHGLHPDHFPFRRVMKMNKIIAAVIVFVVGTVVFFSWVYNRNEPAFLTPLVSRIAPFFPSAGSLRQQAGQPAEALAGAPAALSRGGGRVFMTAAKNRVVFARKAA